MQTVFKPFCFLCYALCSVPFVYWSALARMTIEGGKQQTTSLPLSRSITQSLLVVPFLFSPFIHSSRSFSPSTMVISLPLRTNEANLCVIIINIIVNLSLLLHLITSLSLTCCSLIPLQCPNPAWERAFPPVSFFPFFARFLFRPSQRPDNITFPPTYLTLLFFVRML